MSLDSVPKELRHLRACKPVCSMVKSMDQFLYQGFDNCERYLKMKGNREMVQECTSSNFDGLIAMMAPDDSWVHGSMAENRHTLVFRSPLEKCAKGCYAVSVSGELPQDIIDSLQDRGVPYRSRDTSNK